MKSLRLILSNLTYFAPAWVFTSINILIGTWILYIPYLKLKFELNDAQIGFALFFIALGLLVSIPFISLINNKIGVGKSTKMGIIILAFLYNLPLIVPNYAILCAVLFCMGITSGFTSISLNALTATVEKNEGKSFMSAAHGFFSLGGFIGAGIGSLFMTQFSSPALHMAIITSVIILSTLYLAKNYDKVKGVEKNKQKKETPFYKSIKPLIVISIIAFIVLFNEGSVEHWSNLFLFEIVQVSESKAGLGFVVFSLAMTLGRFLGDGFSNKVGSLKTILYGSFLAFIAYLFIITATVYLSVLGFGLLGLGLSVIIPEIYRVASNVEALDASTAISVVSGVGFVGFLLGPVILGAISNWSNLITSYIFLGGLVLIAFFLTLIRILKKTNKTN